MASLHQVKVSPRTRTSTIILSPVAACTDLGDTGVASATKILQRILIELDRLRKECMRNFIRFPKKSSGSRRRRV